MVFRIQPQMPAQAYKTYELRAPVASHFRPATCAEVDCPAHLHGWRTVIDETSPLGQFQASYIRKESGRAHVEHRDDAGMTVFTFEPGQRCFASGDHRLTLEREPICLVRGGDWRADTGLMRRHVHPEDWVDDFATHQDRIADQIQKG